MPKRCFEGAHPCFNACSPSLPTPKPNAVSSPAIDARLFPLCCSSRSVGETDPGTKRDVYLLRGFRFPSVPIIARGSGNGVKESEVPEFRSSRKDPALLVCEGSLSTPKMNLQLLELSNKRATGNIVIHKSLVISILGK